MGIQEMLILFIIVLCVIVVVATIITLIVILVRKGNDRKPTARKDNTNPKHYQL